MMEQVLDTLEKARVIQERTAERLKSIILPDSHGFELLSDREPVHVRRLYETKDTQVLHVYFDPNTTCDGHEHTISNETFVVILGSIIYNNEEFLAGQTFVVPAGEVHHVGAGEDGGECIVILVPPEEIYTKRK